MYGCDAKPADGAREAKTASALPACSTRRRGSGRSYLTSCRLRSWKRGQLKVKWWLLVQVKVQVSLAPAPPIPIQHRLQHVSEQCVFLPFLNNTSSKCVRREAIPQNPPTHTHEALLLPEDLIYLSDGWQFKVFLEASSGALKTPHLEPTSCEPGLAGLLLGFLLLFFWVLRLHRC